MSLSQQDANKFQWIINTLHSHYEFVVDGSNEDKFGEAKRRLQNVEQLLKDFTEFVGRLGGDSIKLPDESGDSNEAIYSFQTIQSHLFTTLGLFENVMLNHGRSKQKSNDCASGTMQHLKLPTIDLPRFNGNFGEWASFIDTFESLIGSNDTISDIQKLHYLKSCLDDEAKTSLDALKTTGENYAVAIKLLKTRFENRRLTINKHIKTIFDIPAVSKNDHTSLRSLLNALSINLSGLKTLNRPVGQWGDLLVYIISSKLDYFSNASWEESLLPDEIPTYDKLIAFLEKRCQTLQSMQLNKISSAVETKKPSFHAKFMKPAQPKHKIFHMSPKKTSCFFCNGEHNIFKCEKFISLSPKERINKIKSQNRCINCFCKNHSVKDCWSSHCKKCDKKHHTMLHIEDTSSNIITSSESEPGPSMCNMALSSNVLLSTATIVTKSANGTTKEIRALLDIGSQSHLITESLSRELGLQTHKLNMCIKGINGISRIHKYVNLSFQSRTSRYATTVKCLVIPEITGLVPTKNFNLQCLNIPKHIQLADGAPHLATPVDVLLGAELFLNLLISGKIQLGKNQPVLQNTVLGWILGGTINQNNEGFTSCLNIRIDNALSRFWELENVASGSNEAIIASHPCEDHFYKTTHRAPNGQFVVRLPFTENPPNLGNSREIAEKRFLTVEIRRLRNPNLNEAYINFMREYESLGHMEAVTNDSQENSFYLPHSCVFNQNSATTKLRVVFDGSSKSSNSLSLNDNLMAGPVLQPDLFTILIQFRAPQFVLCADISKMYRCILIDPADRNFQKILWRESPESPIKTYRLKTVTYGLTPSSYQAIKCIQQLGHEEQNAYPLAHQIIKNCFYVDDALFGADSIPELIEMKEQLKTVLQKGQFKLSKFSSNSPETLKHERVASADQALIIDKQADKKTLGILWDDRKDAFSYTKFDFSLSKITKRSVLSAIAQLFDPIGLINPVITRAKIIMQQIWSAKIDWDDEIPDSIKNGWSSFIEELPELTQLKFSRGIFCQNAVKTELHGFCDSSEKAFGAVIYVKTIDAHLKVHIHLLCAKSRVAPLKTVSLPRLELCGAVLLANLMSKTSQILNISPENCHFWTDSKIVISWIAADPQRWKTFVANRAAEIQRLTNGSQWRHVKGTENPADIITRGISPRDLSSNALWFQGPEWLEQLNIQYDPPNDTEISEADIEAKRKVPYVAVVQNHQTDFFLLRSRSTFQKLRTTMACWLRVLKNLKLRATNQPEIRGSLTKAELAEATIRIIRLLQQESFSEELRLLKDKAPIKNSRICALNPFLDDQNLIRVGGRISKAAVTYDRKHPILLPKHFVTELIIKDAHTNQLHAGQMGTLAYIRERYWPISGRDQVRKVIHRCVPCFRAKPTSYSQLMGDLPELRVKAARPFLNVGIDFGGPFFIKEARGRGKRLVKSYLALFVCLTTKAVHIELVGDLTTESFLNAMKRVISRRGNIESVISDNATNFVGAARELHKLVSNPSVQSKLSEKGISWKFIPPRSPHFAGLAEAGIKSAKSHLKKVIGQNHLTYEEMYTLLTRIEAVLNSRPLTALTNDVNDLEALTPGHFLIGQAMTAPVEQDHLAVPSNRLSRWQLVEACRQHFWKRWSREYLSTLQGRAKWNKTSTKVPAIGTLVLLKEDNIAALQWRLGRIIALHPGADNLVRVATIKCASGVFKRGIVNLCPLPLSDTE